MRSILILLLLFLFLWSCKKETTSPEPQNESNVIITGDSLEVGFTNFNFIKYDASGNESIRLVGTGNKDSLFIEIYNISLITDSTKISLIDTRDMKIETKLSYYFNYVSNINPAPSGIEGYLIINSFEDNSFLKAEFSPNSHLSLLNYHNFSNLTLSTVEIQGTIKAKRIK
jgi:hypothetical protein